MNTENNFKDNLYACIVITLIFLTGWFGHIGYEILLGGGDFTLTISNK